MKSFLSAQWAQYCVRLCRKVKENKIHSCTQGAYHLVAKINNMQEAFGEEASAHKRERKGQSEERSLLWVAGGDPGPDSVAECPWAALRTLSLFPS